MPEYGEKQYWDERYNSENDPFDWLCDWEQLSPTITPLISSTNATVNNSNKDEDDKKQQPRILCVGCGNAPFSAEMSIAGGYTNIINIDYSEVVIIQQKKRYPQLAWVLMDALDMDFADDEFDVIIDKSLIDTTMCYKNGKESTYQLFEEMHRVLKPGGRLMVISLHAEHEVRPFATLSNPNLTNFGFSSCKLHNQKRKDDSADPRVLYHTFAVFDKLHGCSEVEQQNILNLHPLNIFNAVPPHEIQLARKIYEDANAAAAAAAQESNNKDTDEKKLDSFKDDEVVDQILMDIMISDDIADAIS